MKPLAACASPVFGVAGFEAVAGVAGVAGAWFGWVEAACGLAVGAGAAAPVWGGGEEVVAAAGDAVARFAFRGGHGCSATARLSAGTTSTLNGSSSISLTDWMVSV